jgi:hypothetical protein
MELEYLANAPMRFRERAVTKSLLQSLGLALSWLAFPLVPLVLEDLYCAVCNKNQSTATTLGEDPLLWDLSLWVIMLGPLVGYGFLAGATIGAPDNTNLPGKRWRRFLRRRSVLFAVGPWCGFLLLSALFLGFMFLIAYVPYVQWPSLPNSLRGGWVEWGLGWIFTVLGVVILGYGWVWPAWGVLSRSARAGRLVRALSRGLAVALAFVGSLFGSFWAATAYWREYFFDSRVMPALFLAMTLVVTSGCATYSITYGEVRRRELFHGLLTAWVLGLALMWRWWSRRRPT